MEYEAVKFSSKGASKFQAASESLRDAADRVAAIHIISRFTHNSEMSEGSLLYHAHHAIVAMDSAKKSLQEGLDIDAIRVGGVKEGPESALSRIIRCFDDITEVMALSSEADKLAALRKAINDARALV